MNLTLNLIFQKRERKLLAMKVRARTACTAPGFCAPFFVARAQHARQIIALDKRLRYYRCWSNSARNARQRKTSSPICTSEQEGLKRRLEE